MILCDQDQSSQVLGIVQKGWNAQEKLGGHGALLWHVDWAQTRMSSPMQPGGFRASGAEWPVRVMKSTASLKDVLE